MDPVTSMLITFGVAMLIASWLALIVEGFNEDFAWGMMSVFLPPLSYIYGFFRWDKARDAILLAVLGWFLILIA